MNVLRRDQQRRLNIDQPLVALSLAILVFVGCAAHSSSHPAQEGATVRNKEIVSEFFQKFSAGKTDEAFSLVRDDVSWWVPGDLPFSGTKTKAEYLQVVGSIQRGFPGGLRLEPTSMIAEGDKVAVEVESKGRHANGRDYANKYHFLMTLEDGKITAVKEYMDTLHLYQLIQP